MAEYVPSNEELRIHWNSSSEWYISTAETMTTAIYHTLIPILNLKTAQKIAEAACGTASAIALLLNYLSEDAEVWGNDLSDIMVEKAQARNLARTHIIQASNDALPYEDNFFDRYISNLSLMIVPDADSMLREAYRILAPGGRAVFSVWGSQEKSNAIGNFENAYAELSPENGRKKRSHFYLNNLEDLKRRVEHAGFKDIYHYRSMAPFGVLGVEDSMNWYKSNPYNVAIKNQNEVFYDRLMSRLRENVEDMVKRGETLMFEVIVVVAFK